MFNLFKLCVCLVIIEIVTATEEIENIKKLKNYDLIKLIDSVNVSNPDSLTFLTFAIKSIYQKNIKNGEELINLLDSSKNAEDFLAYRILFDEIKSSGDLYSVSSMMLAKRCEDSYRIDNINLMHISDNLPTNIRSFPWNSKVTIKNVEFKEYLYADNDDFAFDSSKRRVFTMIKGSSGMDCISNECFWEVYPISKGTSFHIKFTYKFNEYLFADRNSNLYDSSRRRVFTWRKENKPKETEWQFEPVADTNYFRIKNVYWNEYLYAGAGFDYDEKRRRVFLWRKSGCDGAACEWMINKI